VRAGPRRAAVSRRRNAVRSRGREARDGGVARERTERRGPPSHATLGPAAPEAGGRRPLPAPRGLGGGRRGHVGLSYAQQVRRWGGRWHLDLDGGRGAVRGRSSDLRPEGRPRAADPCACARGQPPGRAPSAAQARASRLRGGHVRAHGGAARSCCWRRPRLLLRDGPGGLALRAPRRPPLASTALKAVITGG